MSGIFGDKNKLKDVLQDSNISFLIGSGLSTPFLSSLGGIEDLLTAVDKHQRLEGSRKNIIRSFLYKQYCEKVIFKNIQILKNDAASLPIAHHYKTFLTLINTILLNRKNTILSKQINIFTTNIDIFFEKALDELGLEYNDGFSGRFVPTFNLSNFRKSAFKKSLQYDNMSEIPVFNLLKLHGSLTWTVNTLPNGDKGIKFCTDLDHVKKVKSLDLSSITEAQNGQTLDHLIAIAGTRRISSSVASFLEAYQEFPIINPTKEKFKQTLLNQIHYELLRMYANELEKENSVLFVMGFSFADEHIREITLRALDSNPTLTVYIIAYSSDSVAGYEAKLGIANAKNRNIKVIVPEEDKDNAGTDAYKHDFENINGKIFEPLADEVEKSKRVRS